MQRWSESQTQRWSDRGVDSLRESCESSVCDDQLATPSHAQQIMRVVAWSAPGGRSERDATGGAAAAAAAVAAVAGQRCRWERSAIGCSSEEWWEMESPSVALLCAELEGSSVLSRKMRSPRARVVRDLVREVP